MRQTDLTKGLAELAIDAVPVRYRLAVRSWSVLVAVYARRRHNSPLIGRCSAVEVFPVKISPGERARARKLTFTDPEKDRALTEVFGACHPVRHVCFAQGMVKTTYKLAAPFWEASDTLRNRPISRSSR